MQLRATIVGLACVAACGSVHSSSDANNDVTAVTVSPDTVALKRGFDTPKQLAAAATNGGGTMDVTATAMWSSSDAAIATVSGGLVTATGAGTVTITATYGGKSGTATFTITNAQMLIADAASKAIYVFDAFATGNTAPVRAISGPTTTLGFPWSVAVLDSEIYVADLTANAIDVFPLDATGDVAPVRRITTPAPYIALAIFNHELYTATNNGSTSTIVVYPTTWTGTTPTPTRTITGNATTLLAEINGIAIYNNEIYVSSEQSGAANVVVFPVTAHDHAAPSRTIAGAQTQLHDIWDVRVVGDEIFVADLARGGNPDPGVPGGSPSVYVFPVTASGNATPTRTLSGAQSGIAGPIPMMPLGDELYTVDIEPSPKVTVHAKSATGDAAPTRTLAGTATKLTGPRGIAFF